MFRVPEKYRVTGASKGFIASDSSYGNNGCFEFKVGGIKIRTVASDGFDWEHVSVTRKDKKMPNWNIMCMVKFVFWDKEDCVIQYHPPAADNISFHDTCLHLWKPTKVIIPMPPSIMVGPKGIQKK